MTEPLEVRVLQVEGPRLGPLQALRKGLDGLLLSLWRPRAFTGPLLLVPRVKKERSSAGARGNRHESYGAWGTPLSHDRETPGYPLASATIMPTANGGTGRSTSSAAAKPASARSASSSSGAYTVPLSVRSANPRA